MISQAQANYRRGDPVDHCGLCAYFRGGQHCAQVSGAISPYGISDVYRRVQNPFGSTLSANELQAIKAMAADVSDRSGYGGA